MKGKTPIFALSLVAGFLYAFYCLYIFDFI